MVRFRPPPAAPEESLAAGAAALGLLLTPDHLAAFQAYREEIARWSRRINITGLREPQAIVRAGFLDSLACLPLIPPEVRRVLDVGSGAGFPALPIKLVRPDLDLTLVEASRKRASFLRHMVRCLGLGAVRVIQARVEALAMDPREASAYDLALARAVAAIPAQGELVRPFLRPGGLFLAQVGPGGLRPGARSQLLGLGFELLRELPLPAALGRRGASLLLRRLP